MAQPKVNNENEDEIQAMNAAGDPTAQASASDEPPSLVEFIREEQKKAEELTEIEEHWRDRYDMLLEHGYQLRRRLRPGWVPSWRDTDQHPNLFEDAYGHWTRQIVDATRTEDGQIVAIKEVKRSAKAREIEVMRNLTPDPLHPDSKNHCAPLLDHFLDDREPEFEFMVMPLYREFDDPPFYAVGEVIDFVHQTLEGMQYMHSKHVAHRDAASANIMMDGSSLFPKGYHPSALDLTPSCKEQANPLERIHALPVKYVFIDFGISLAFKDADEHLILGFFGREQAPELEDFETPHDPFRLDIYVLGKVYETEFLKKYSNVAFLQPLVDSMTQKDPKKRPTINEAIEQFNKIRKSKGRLASRTRLHDVKETWRERLFNDTLAVVADVRFLFKRLLPRRLFRKAPS